MKNVFVYSFIRIIFMCGAGMIIMAVLNMTPFDDFAKGLVVGATTVFAQWYFTEEIQKEP